MESVPGDPAEERPREWLALPGGGIRPVVSVPGPGGIAELLAYAAWLARLRPVCHAAALAWARAGPAEPRSA